MINDITETANARLFGLYARYVGEPQSRKDVYGYWVFLAGSIVSFLGILVYLLGKTSLFQASEFFFREVSTSMAATGLPLAILGILLLLPVKRRGIQASVLGVAVALLGVALFVSVYPQSWAVGTPDYSGLVITIYVVGVAAIVAVAALVPVVTGEKSFFFEADYEREGDYPDVMVGERDHGGVFSVFKRGDEWQWRLVEQDAAAGGITGHLSRLETEETVDRVRRKVTEAGLMEIKNAAFRLYESAEKRWRWVLMREDGSVIAESEDAFESRDDAAESVSDLKDFGPDALLLDIDGAAFDIDEDGGWRWRLLDEARTPIAECPASYGERHDAEAAVERVRAAGAEADDLTLETYGVELVSATRAAVAADGGDGDVRSADGGGGADLADDAEPWSWRLVDADANELATGSRRVGSRRAAESMVYDLLDGLADAPVVDAGTHAFEVTPGERDTEWRWRLVTADDRVLARSPDDAGDEPSATRSAERMRAGAADADVVVVDDAEFEYFRVGDGWRWRLVTADRRALAEATRSHESREATAAAIEQVKTQAGEADLIEYEGAAFQVYESDTEWRWRLIDEDGNVMTDSGAKHTSREQATSSMTTVKENAPSAELLEIDTAAFELFEDDGRWNWRLVDESGETTARGSEWADSKTAAREAMDRLTDHTGASSREMEEMTFQVYTVDDEWRWRVVHPDGAVLATSERAHTTRDEAIAAIEDDVQAVAEDAEICTVETAAIRLAERGERWSWRLLDDERSELAESAVEYGSREGVVEAVERLQAGAADLPVFGLTGPTYLLTSRDDGWEWRLVDENWATLAGGVERYPDRRAAHDAVDRLSQLLPDAGTLEYDAAAFELFEDDGRWRWRLLDEDERVVAAGAEGYESRGDATEALADVRAEVADASVLEIDTAAFELHRDEAGWRWRLLDESGTPLAESSVAHPSRREARDAMDFVKTEAPRAMTSVAE